MPKQVFRGNEEPFPSKDAAADYARRAGFTVDGNYIASRDDMTSTFKLVEVPGGNRSSQNMWAWVRPGFAAQYKLR
jgi:hypothetical protein